METRTKKVNVEPVMFIEHDTKRKCFVGSLGVEADCVGYDAIKNVEVQDTSRLKVFAHLEESIAALSKVLVIEKVVRTRKPRIISK